ncbi:MAG: squalene/phytoene synthase family protein [Phycisphaeraceae bacterium]
MSAATEPATPLPRPALQIDALRYRALRQLTKQHNGDLFFAAYFLPKSHRYALWSLDALRRQLEDILGCPQTKTGRPPATAGSCGAAGCSEGGCEGESIDTRRGVCLSVIDHLYNKLDTGKPELDAFLQVRPAFDLPRSLLDEWIQGASAERTLPRYATWKRLNEVLAGTGGAPAMLMAHVLAAAPASLESPTVQGQIQAWGAAMRFISILENAGSDFKAGRLMLPLDDLIKAGLSEQAVGRFAEAGTTGGDERWMALMTAMLDRIRNLLRGGARSLAIITHAGTRRAVAALSVFAYDRLQRLMKAGGDPFATRITTSTWRRIRLMPRAARLALEPERAADVFV